MTEPIAIVGMACRFPGGATSPGAFWDLLSNGVDAIQQIDREGIELERFYDPTPKTPGRMMTRWGGFLDGLERFDAAFFGISPREAASVDPAQRLLLEAAWEAFEDATIDPAAATGESVGVFVGQWLSDFENRLFADTDQIDFHFTTGSGRYASSGRVSFVLGAVGPSITVDTACSSSLVAVHLACQSLRSGESVMAIAAGVNVILQPHISVAYSQSGMMAPDGHCKFGDANGDGYVRSEGVGVVLLKPLAAALADGDRVRAVIRGSAVNNDGRGSGHLATPSRTGQAAMLRSAYANAGVEPSLVGYVEGHGTGTRAGDPVELGALGDVLSPGRAPEHRFLVGSVKTNIGHTEGAAGLAGLMKCVLALEHEAVPPSLHLHEPNPAIPWDELPLDIPQRTTPWARHGRPRLAGVSAFGITGTNAHVVVEEAPLAVPSPSTNAPPTTVLALSAASPEALRALADSYAELLTGDTAPPLHHVCATAARHRAALAHRAVFVADDARALAERLRLFAGGDDAAADASGDAGVGTARRVAFVFPGQGGQWIGMARELLAEEPAFRAAIERCDQALPPGLGWSVREQLEADPETGDHRLDEISVIQPVLLAVELALAELWQSWGIVPEAVVGHSMGEIGAAFLAGAISLPDAMQIICTRSALMQRTSGTGAMAVVELSGEEVSSRIAAHGERVGIAVINGPRSTVISGDADVVTAIVSDCKRDDVFARSVKVDVASHSPHMEPLVPELVAGLLRLEPRPATIGLYSTVDAAARPGEEWDASYWGRNLRQPVRFGPTIEVMLAAGIDTVIEVGPHPTLLSSVAQAPTSRPPLTLGSLRRSAPERASMLAALGGLWAAGHPIGWQAIFADGTYRRVPLPLYPWQRERHWADAALPAVPSGTARPRRLDETMQRWIHALHWEPTPVAKPGATADSGSWMVVGLPGADRAAVEAALAAHGADVAVADSIEQGVARLGAAGPKASTPLDVVVLVGPGVGAYAPVAAVRQLSGRSADRSPQGLRLWWVTQGAQVLPGDEPLADAVEHAALWGAARVVAAEHPESRGGLVDLDPAVSVASQAGALANHLCARDDEDQAAVRDGQRFALRLVQAEPDPKLPASPPWRADAAYLITGGLGGVARQIAASMVRDGARRLVLLGRSPLPPRAQWSDVDAGTELGRRIGAVRALEHAGASVHVISADVSDDAAVEAALDAYAAEGWPAIAGVIHAAGILDNQLTTDLDPATFDRVLAPKLGGARILDRLLPELDVFVVFSSFFSFWALEGMANYAAANAGLDALVQARRSRGHHALSIQWGAWSDIGMLEQVNAARTIHGLEREGVGSFTGEQGSDCFASLVGARDPVLAVVPIDWATFRSSGRQRAAALFRSAPGADAAATLLGGGALDRLRDAAPPDRRALLEQIVREIVGAVLRLPAGQLDAHRPFGTLGLDSLMALELRNRLEAALALELSATLAWNYPTVEALTAHLDATLAPPPSTNGATAEPLAAEPAEDRELSELLGDLHDMSDDDATALLRGAR